MSNFLQKLNAVIFVADWFEKLQKIKENTSSCKITRFVLI